MTEYPASAAERRKTVDKKGCFRYTKFNKREGGKTVEIEIRVKPGLDKPNIVIETPALTPEVEALARALQERALSHTPPLLGFRGEEITALEPGDVLRFYGADKAVFAQTEGGEYRVRERLYELEEALDPRRFVRISQSELVNLKKVTALDLSLTGTIKMTLTGGTVCWVSRRNVKNIKKALGL